jgi:hypothetical protein
MRYRLRTLLIVLALGPPVLAASWDAWQRWVNALELRQLDEAIRAFRLDTGDFPPATL